MRTVALAWFMVVVVTAPAFAGELNAPVPTLSAAEQTAEVEQFIRDLNDPRLYDVVELVYAGNPAFPMRIHLRKGLGWPQSATLVINRATGELLMGTLVSTHDFSRDRVTAVFMDEGFLQEGSPSGRLVQTNPDDAGSRFYDAYRRFR